MIREVKLYSHDLRKIADALDVLQTSHGIKVTTFQCGNLVVTVDESNHQLDGRSIYVTGITNATNSH